MTLLAFAGAESGESGLYRAYADAAIVTTPTLSGSYCYEIDPVNGNVFDQYGWKMGLDNPNLLDVSFIFRFDTAFVGAGAAIVELGDGNPVGLLSRKVTIGTDSKIAIFDDDDDQVGKYATALSVDTNYPMLYRLDQLSLSDTEDTLWIWISGAWVKAIDVSGHGDALDTISVITFGSSKGKGLPDSGGKFFVDNMVVQNLEQAPNKGAFGSFDVKYRAADGSGVDSDFDGGDDGGGGWGNPNFQNVDEIPSNDATDYDQGDAVGEKQSYTVANAGSGDAVLALTATGTKRQSTAGTATIKMYVYDGATRDVGITTGAAGTTWSKLHTGTTGTVYNQVNSVDLSESLFNTLEVGMEITVLPGGMTIDLSQFGLDYVIGGPQGLPSDYPVLPTPRRRGLTQVI